MSVLRTRKKVRDARLHKVFIPLTSAHLSLGHVQALLYWKLFSGTYEPLFVMSSTAKCILYAALEYAPQNVPIFGG
jgi:hypothetical protein